MSQEEFCERFVTHMVQVVGETDGDGNSVREYAREVAPTYFEDGEIPEACADSDLACWE